MATKKETGRVTNVQPVAGTTNQTLTINRDATQIPDVVTVDVTPSGGTTFNQGDRIIYDIDQGAAGVTVSNVEMAPGTNNVRVRVESEFDVSSIMSAVNQMVSTLDGASPSGVRIAIVIENDSTGRKRSVIRITHGTLPAGAEATYTELAKHAADMGVKGGTGETKIIIRGL